MAGPVNGTLCIHRQARSRIADDFGGELHEGGGRYPRHAARQKEIDNSPLIIGLLGGVDQIGPPGRSARAEPGLDRAEPFGNRVRLQAGAAIESRQPGFNRRNDHGRCRDPARHFANDIGKAAAMYRRKGRIAQPFRVEGWQNGMNIGRVLSAARIPKPQADLASGIPAQDDRLARRFYTRRHAVARPHPFWVKGVVWSRLHFLLTQLSPIRPDKLTPDPRLSMPFTHGDMQLRQQCQPGDLDFGKPALKPGPVIFIGNAGPQALNIPVRDRSVVKLAKCCTHSVSLKSPTPREAAHFVLR